MFFIGYHQKCHSPEITSDVLQTNAEWFCRQCVFGNSAKVMVHVCLSFVYKRLLAMLHVLVSGGGGLHSNCECIKGIRTGLIELSEGIIGEEAS